MRFCLSNIFVAWHKTPCSLLVDATMASNPEDNSRHSQDQAFQCSFRRSQDLARQDMVDYNEMFESERLREWQNSLCLGLAGACALSLAGAAGRPFRTAGAAGPFRTAATTAALGVAGFVVGYMAPPALGDRVFGKSDGLHAAAAHEGCDFYRSTVEPLLCDFYTNPTADISGELTSTLSDYLELSRNWPSPYPGARAIAAFKCSVDVRDRHKPEERKVWGGMRWRHLHFGGAVAQAFPFLLPFLPCSFYRVLPGEAMRSYFGPSSDGGRDMTESLSSL